MIDDCDNKFWDKYKILNEIERRDLLKTLPLFEIFLDTKKELLISLLKENNCEHLFFSSIQSYIDDIIDKQNG